MENTERSQGNPGELLRRFLSRSPNATTWQFHTHYQLASVDGLKMWGECTSYMLADLYHISYWFPVASHSNAVCLSCHVDLNKVYCAAVPVPKVTRVELARSVFSNIPNMCSNLDRGRPHGCKAQQQQHLLTGRDLPGLDGRDRNN